MTKPRNHAGHAYGFCVAYKLEDADKWTIDPEEDTTFIPAYYEILEEAIDRVEYLRLNGISARVLTLLAERGDTKHGNTQPRPTL